MQDRSDAVKRLGWEPDRESRLRVDGQPNSGVVHEAVERERAPAEGVRRRLLAYTVDEEDDGDTAFADDVIRLFVLAGD